MLNVLTFCSFLSRFSVKIKLSLFLFFAISLFPPFHFYKMPNITTRIYFFLQTLREISIFGWNSHKQKVHNILEELFFLPCTSSFPHFSSFFSSSLPPHSASSLVAGWQFKWTFNPNQGALQELAWLPSPKWRREMDTLGVCGTPSIAADNGVIMVKEPRLERVSDNLDPPPLPPRGSKS